MGLNERFIKTTVLFKGIDTSGKSHNGTGFLFIGPHAYNKHRFSSFVVTNKHLAKNLKNASIQFYFDAARAKQKYELNCDIFNYFCHPDDEIDICIFLIKTDIAVNIHFLNYKTQILKKDDLESNNVSEGDLVYCIGYPDSLEKVDYAKANNGVIHDIKSLYEGISNDFSIDAQVSPGNSGSPIILEGTNGIKSKLIGIVHEYQAIEKNNKIVYTGIGNVLPMDCILDTIQFYYEYIGKEFSKEIEILSKLALHENVTKYLEWNVEHDNQLGWDKLKKNGCTPTKIKAYVKYLKENNNRFFNNDKRDLKRVLKLLRKLLDSPFIELVARESEIPTSKNLISKYLSEIDRIKDRY
ncbi:serine protease [Methanobacterium sp.]|uniref:S1 family peptidase n=1 Tax=Methanobacterium sp. TaxID=2164 RepID=UPI0025FE0CC2|nr:serine protease [Methanobacterium sp.]MBI5458611.1 trypsin-like peptidase domain-containing protein [Methanobacterium sp.]